MTEHIYQVKVDFEQGRVGTMTSEVLVEVIKIATPPEFPKGVPGIWSPEHYFVAAINGCLLTTFLAIAENFKLNFVDFSSDSEGILARVDGKFMMREVILRPSIVIEKEEDRELAEKVIIKAERACLISNSVKTEIKLEYQILVNSTITR